MGTYWIADADLRRRERRRGTRYRTTWRERTSSIEVRITLWPSVVMRCDPRESTLPLTYGMPRELDPIGAGKDEECRVRAGCSRAWSGYAYVYVTSVERGRQEALHVSVKRHASAAVHAHTTHKSISLARNLSRGEELRMPRRRKHLWILL